MLDPAPEVLERLGLSLGPEEAERAAKLRFPRDARRYVAAHGVVRVVLGGYLGLPAAAVAFTYGPSGKPSLASSYDSEDVVGEASPVGRLHFSLSHSGGLGAIAVATCGQVGLDLELVRDLPDLDRLAQIVFSPRELVSYQDRRLDRKMRCFYAGWTRKEAVVKACGDGIGLGLDTFDVPVGRSGVVDLGERGRWLVRGLALARGYAGALAIPARVQAGSASGRPRVRVVRHVWPLAGAAVR
jgi:4'-phosphopantetheinyl transferase